jgi:two-component system CheB/CheR fusion protein
MARKSVTENQDLTNKAGDLCIVGVGASAGGMEAIHDVFDYMPPETGFAFVVIQHLSPDHKSLMAELLSKHTNMKVYEAQDGMEIKPNCTYVIPSKKLITVRNGTLYLDEKLKSRLPNNAIDVFFESLAEDKGEHAVGIILSGTGTDGTKGIEAIKQKNGVVVVQDPLTASFDGMPNSAIASGFVDMVLPPENIGEELVEYLKEAPLVRALSEHNKQNELILQDILTDLHKLTRHDFSNYKRPTLFRRMAKRMTEVGINSLEEYREHLLRHEDELKILDKEFLINVTKFFRDTDAFKCLQTEAIPAIVSTKKQEEHIKVWVIACSSGEEAYSIAILFLEHFHAVERPAGNLKIFATDIDPEALETASRGIYGPAIVKDIPGNLLKKYFTQDGSQYRVVPELRKHVVFANHDVLKDPPFSHLDLITCRNMFIYINAQLQRKILKKFHFAMNIDSFLMLGPSENIGALQDAMQEVSRKWKLYRCMTKAGMLDQEVMLLPVESRFTGKAAASNLKNISSNLTEIFKDTLLEERKIAAVFIDKDFNVKQAIGSYKSFLQFPEDHFNFNLLKLVSSDMAVALGVVVRKAISQNEKSIMRRVMLHEPDGLRLVNIIVKPYIQQSEFRQPFLCVILEEEHAEPRILKTVEHNPSMAGSMHLEELEQELVHTRENLQAVIEELETANEELQSSNEEMISTNEELQSTNEELQSLNEELHTVSAEHQLKIKELLELNDDLNNYFRNSDIGQILLDKNLIVRKFSPAVTRMVNLIESDVGRCIADITTNIRKADLVVDIQTAIKNVMPIEREVQIGNDRYYLMKISPYVRRDKIPEGAVVNFIDITESKRLGSILESVFQSSISGITAKRAIRSARNEIVDFEYIAINSAAENFFGVHPGSLLHKRLTEVFPRSDKKFFDIYCKVVETGVMEQFEFHHEHTGKWFDVSVVKMLDGLVTTHTDITEKKKATNMIAQNFEDLKAASQQLINSNVQLERSNFDLLQFASVASHDLKEPLRKIQAFGNILQSKIQDKLTGTELSYLQKMVLASSRMQTLIEDVLTLSKLSNSGVPKEQIDLSRLIRLICEDLEITIKEKNATIKIDRLPIVEAVPGQMRQLFQNLISNSLKFSGGQAPNIFICQKPLSSEEAREINVQGQEFTCINISDNGIGFENQYRDKIFGVFQRLHGRNYEGTGIGLAIAKKIVENHGGQINASGEINKGAEFNIFLPLFSDNRHPNKNKTIPIESTLQATDGSGS